MIENLSTLTSYLSFKLGDEVFAANVSKVLNILEMTKITKVPKAPDYMKGVINLRGTVLPLVDTRIKFGLTATEFTANTCILVLDIQIGDESLQVGGLVDAVQEVLEIEEYQILPAPNIGSKYHSEFISGMYKINEDQFSLLTN
jgi:purine-binding chemotaxis protein CheW